MMLSNRIATYKSKYVEYVLLQNNVVGMGKNDGVFSYSILKKSIETNEIITRICNGIKSKNAIDLIWNDVINGIQK